MATLFSMSVVPAMATQISYPANRGEWANAGLVCISRQSLPTDPIGSTTVTFSGVRAGTEIRVYLPDGTELTGTESCDVNHVLTWQVYAAGSANNTVTIRIVNTAYKIKEFDYTSTVGAVSLPVQQELDKWYSDPI